METQFNYFSEIEDQYLRRRGGGLLLSTLDWALIETWKDAGIPLEAVLRGIDAAFDRYEQRPSRTRKVNSLAYCTQEVLAAAGAMNEAAVGSNTATGGPSLAKGLSIEEIASFCLRNADRLASAALPEQGGVSAGAVAREISTKLQDLADEVRSSLALRLEDVERRLTVFEEKLFAALVASTCDDELTNMKAAVDRELQPYRSKMPAAQIGQLHRQYVNKRLLEKHNLPRISLFYL